MVRFTVSAPGKVILHGEHAVVYGKRALAASLGLRTYLTLSTSNNADASGRINLNFSSINLAKSFKVEQISALLLNASSTNRFPPTLLTDTQYTNQLALLQTFLTSNHPNLTPADHNALLSFLLLFTCLLTPFDLTAPSGQQRISMSIEVRTDLTVSAGLGSSASFLVCVAAGLSCYRRLRDDESDWVFSEGDLKEFSNWAFNAERIIHGTPSGVDNTICTFGALVEFRKGFPPVPVPFPEDTGTFKLIALLINTKVPKNTKEMVAKVADLKQRCPNIVGPILDAIDETTASALGEFKVLTECLKRNKPTATTDIPEAIKNSCSKLEQLFATNQNLLSSLGVSHVALDNVCRILAAHGIKAKLTGAGGGGYAIALVPAPLYDHEVIRAAIGDLEAEGYEGKVLELGGLGVTVNVHGKEA